MSKHTAKGTKSPQLKAPAALLLFFVAAFAFGLKTETRATRIVAETPPAIHRA
jgi:hypothetical protein